MIYGALGMILPWLYGTGLNCHINMMTDIMHKLFHENSCVHVPSHPEIALKFARVSLYTRRLLFVFWISFFGEPVNYPFTGLFHYKVSDIFSSLSNLVLTNCTNRNTDKVVLKVLKLSSLKPSYGASPTPLFYTSHKPMASHTTSKPSYVKKPKPNKQLYYTTPKPAYHSTSKPSPKTPRSPHQEVRFI